MSIYYSVKQSNLFSHSKSFHFYKISILKIHIANS